MSLSVGFCYSTISAYWDVILATISLLAILQENDMKVSVIIPFYNAEDYLQECLDSVFNQTMQDFELICVDDGSTDASLDILNNYLRVQGDRISIFSQEHAGPGAARNLALRHAEGEYVYFLDSDDFAEPELLEHSVRIAEEKNADVVVFDAWLYNQRFLRRQLPSHSSISFEFPKMNKQVFSWKDFPENILTAFQDWPRNKLYKRAFLEEYKIEFSNLHHSEDALFTCQALVHARNICLLNERLINFRMSQKNSVMALKDRYPLEGVQACISLHDFLCEQGVYSQLEKTYLSWVIDHIMQDLNSMASHEAFLKLYNELKNGALKELGILNAPLHSLQQSQKFDDYEMFITTDADGYLFYQSQMLQQRVDDLTAQLDFADLAVRNTKKEYQNLEKEYCEIERFKAGYMETIAQLNAKIYDLQHSADWRIGHSLCKVSRLFLKGSSEKKEEK